MSLTDRLGRVTAINQLTDEQRSRAVEWRDKWIAQGLKTGPADRNTFESAVVECYKAAGLAPPGSIVWVQSPAVLAVAAPIASFVIALAERDPLKNTARGAIAKVARDAVGDAVLTAVSVSARSEAAGVMGAVRDAVAVAVHDTVAVAVDDAVAVAVHDTVCGAVINATVATLDEVITSVTGAAQGVVDAAVLGTAGGAPLDAVRDAVRSAVDGVAPLVRGKKSVAALTRNSVLCAIRDGWWCFFGGQLWVGDYWWSSSAIVSFFREVCGLSLDAEIGRAAVAYQKTCESACWWWPHRDFVMVCERPTEINRDARGRLHSDKGPAIVWPDGWGVYSINGVRVPARIVENPETIDLREIESEPNAEVRRVMIARYGIGRYLADSGADVLHEDRDGRGAPRRLFRKLLNDGTIIVQLQVENASAEPDGSYRTYFLPCHPELRPLPLPGGLLGPAQSMTCHNAVASTFGLLGEDYHPDFES